MRTQELWLRVARAEILLGILPGWLLGGSGENHGWCSNCRRAYLKEVPSEKRVAIDTTDGSVPSDRDMDMQMYRAY